MARLTGSAALHNHQAGTRLRIASIIEANVVTGPAKNILRFASENRGRLDFQLVTFERRRDTKTESENKFVARARSLGLPIYVLDEDGRFDVRLLDRLRQFLRVHKPDIVQTHSVKSHFLLSLIRSSDFAWIAFHHGYTAEDLKMRAYHQFDRWSLRNADRVITVCKPFVRQLQKRGVRPDLISVLPNSIDLAILQIDPAVRSQTRAKFSVEDDEILALAIGRLSPEKGHRDLIEAFSQVRTEKPELRIKLLIAGDGPLMSELKTKIEQANLRGVIQLAGHISDVRPLFSAADMFLLPSLSEGSPNVLLEAMAARLPIVATAVGGVPETIVDGESGLLTPPAVPSALAKSILQICEDPNQASVLVRNSYERVRTLFTPEAYNERLFGVYEQVLHDMNAT